MAQMKCDMCTLLTCLYVLVICEGQFFLSPFLSGSEVEKFNPAGHFCMGVF